MPSSTAVAYSAGNSAEPAAQAATTESTRRRRRSGGTVRSPVTTSRSPLESGRARSASAYITNAGAPTASPDSNASVEGIDRNPHSASNGVSAQTSSGLWWGST